MFKVNAKIIAILGSVLVVALVAAYLVQRTAQDIEPEAGHGQLQSDDSPSATSTDQSSQEPPPGTSKQETLWTGVEEDDPVSEVDGSKIIRNEVKQTFSSNSAAEMLESLAALAETNPEYAAKKAKEVSEFCDPTHIAAAKELGRPEDLIAKRESFCEDFSEASVDDVKDQLSLLPEPTDDVERVARDPYRGPQEEFRSRLDSAKTTERSDVFTEMVRNAYNPDQIFELITLNQGYASRNGGVPLWELGKDLLQFHQQADLVSAQQTALLLFSCQRFGGCGPNQYFRLVLCSINFFRTCPPGTSVEQSLYQTTPPADFDLAEAILNRI